MLLPVFSFDPGLLRYRKFGKKMTLVKIHRFGEGLASIVSSKHLEAHRIAVNHAGREPNFLCFADKRILT